MIYIRAVILSLLLFCSYATAEEQNKTDNLTVLGKMGPDGTIDEEFEKSRRIWLASLRAVKPIDHNEIIIEKLLPVDNLPVVQNQDLAMLERYIALIDAEYFPE